MDENGNAEDPYKLLEPVFNDLTVDQLETLVISENSGMNDGGAAMMAYARMHFGEMTDFERESYKNALLRYCELDTLVKWQSSNQKSKFNFLFNTLFINRFI